MTGNVPPQYPNTAHHQQAAAEATRRAQEYQRQLAHKQQLEEQKRARERQTQLDAEARRRASQTGQGR
jgi:hypothetical protein